MGVGAVACLFVFGQELSTYGLLLAVLLAILLPRYLERAWRHDLTLARRAMLIAMIAALAVSVGIIALQGGFKLPAK